MLLVLGVDEIDDAGGSVVASGDLALAWRFPRAYVPGHRPCGFAIIIGSYIDILL